MNKIFEYLVYSFYLINHKYAYRTGNSIEASTKTFFAALFTLFLFDPLFFLFAIINKYCFQNSGGLQYKGIMLLIFIAAGLLIFFLIKRLIKDEYLKNIFKKYEHKISKKEAAFLMIIMFISAPLIGYLTLTALDFV